MKSTLKQALAIASFLALTVTTGCASLSLDGGDVGVAGTPGEQQDILAVMAADSQTGD
jgi:hypothetical protein